MPKSAQFKIPDGIDRRRKYLDSVVQESFSAGFAKVLRGFLATVPDAFFEAPASSSAQYHPDWAQGDGGLMRHSLAAFWWCNELTRLVVLGDARMEEGARAAALLHDCFKGWRLGDDGIESWGATRSDHGEVCGQRLLAYYEMVVVSEKRDTVVSLLVHYAAVGMKEHMVQWGSPPLVYPARSTLVQLVAMSDYVASRRGACSLF